LPIAVSAEWDDRIGRRLRLRDLHILSTVVRWGSMAKAASHLRMSQPSISEAIANLEAAIGVRLLDRSPRGVEPTIYADVLLKRGVVVFDELNQGIKDIEFLADSAVGEVRIGCVESLMAGFVPTVIDRLSRSYPRVLVHVELAYVITQEFRDLRARTADLMLGRIFGPVADDDIEAEILCQDKFVVVANAQSPWARRRKIALAELINEPWIMYPPNNVVAAFMSQAFRANGLDVPRGGVTSYSWLLRMHLLATGRFLTIIAESALKHNAERWALKALPINLDIPSLPIAVFRLKNRTQSRAIELFVQHAREVAKSISNGR
jgi:DNA-binding transcriptional LysR family regulator